MKEIILKNGQSAILRLARKEDAAKMIYYMNTIATESNFLTFEPGELNLTIKKQEAVIQNNLLPGKLFIVVELDNIIIGNLSFSSGHKIRSRHAGEFGITVMKAYWNNGIGSEMIAYMIDWAKASNVIKKINLKVRTDNPRAISLYTKFNFRCEGVLTRNFYIDGVFYDSLEMGLLL